MAADYLRILERHIFNFIILKKSNIGLYIFFVISLIVFCGFSLISFIL
ncbi:Uncharacterised protein [Chlamydia trachomatis]|nr:Uncharacterised protein [Chlamydia trachomatis]CRH54680.1 Uncharacterised protein [Chlamydia trachomatis]CRH56810.1 Uncharacterised protein [Chlamydia trachomatis]CRH56813.1 Uncharacterised protein [Chlamydia trachomatis]